MFLSTLNSRLEDGWLVVDLSSEGGPMLCLSPYSDGMRWCRQCAEGWQDTAFDWAVRLVSKAQYCDDLPVNRYLASWPSDLLVATEPMWYAQASMLQLCARFPAARDLARSNPVLLWLAAAAYSESSALRERLPELLDGSQRCLLAALLGRSSCSAYQVRFLRKLVIMRGDHSTLRWIRCAVGRAHRLREFSHWRHFPSSLLCYLHGPLLHRMRWLGAQLSSIENPWFIEQALEPGLQCLADTHTMLSELRRFFPEDANRLLTKFSPNWSGVERLHDELVCMHGLDLDAIAGMLGLDPDRGFGPPPMPSDTGFEAITTVGGLLEESRLMKHCVFTRVNAVLAGKCYVFRVLTPGQRATLQLGLSAGREPVIDELRGVENDEAMPETLALVNEWMAKYVRGRKQVA